MSKFYVVVIIHIMLIIILIGLIGRIEIQEKSFNCESCQAKFINRIGYDEENILEYSIYENLTRMYEYYSKGDCSVRWVDGGYSGGLINQTIYEDE